jgi:hypothetical protein
MEKKPEIFLSLIYSTSLHNKYRNRSARSQSLTRVGVGAQGNAEISVLPCPDLACLPTLLPPPPPPARPPCNEMMGTTNATQYLHLYGIEIRRKIGISQWGGDGIVYPPRVHGAVRSVSASA